MSKIPIEKIKSQTPVSLIVHGGNRQGYLLAKTLVDQGAHVVIVDKYNAETKKYISDLKKSGNVDFFDFKGLDSLYKKLKKFDYLFYLLNNKLTEEEYDSKKFLAETNTLENSLKMAKKHNAKVSLITSLRLNRELSNRINNEEVSKPSPYSNTELQKYCETLAAEFKDKTDSNLRIIRLATLIGSGIEKIDNKELDELFTDATQKAQITIKGEGLEIHNLIHENDATYGILRLTFSDKTKGEVVTLSNKNDYTTLSIAYKLLELDTEAQSIKFVEEDASKFIIRDLYIPAPHASKYSWSQQTTLEEGLIEEIQNYYDKANKKWSLTEEKRKPKTESRVEKTETLWGNILSTISSPFTNLFKNKKELNSKQVLKFSGIAIGLLALVYYLIYPILGIAIGTTIVYTTTMKTKDGIFELESSEIEKNIQVVEKNLDRVSDSFNNIYWLFRITGQNDLYDNSTQLLLGFQYAAEGADSLIDGVSPLLMYIKDFEPAIDLSTSTPTTTREYRSYLESMENNSYKIDNAAYKISLSNEIVNSVSTSTFPKAIQDSILEIKDTLSEIETATTSIQEVSSFLPDLLGVEERKRYLILLQNESEIRSTGGWLTSYGILGIEGGQVRELFVDDIYNADGTLKAQDISYTPPSSMQSALDIDDWTFSLVNWSPDLSETLADAEPFVKELGKGNDLDGVITIDIGFVQKVLNKWDGIEVPGESEMVTSDNIYSKIFEMHKEFTPGSTEKTTFLANLANEIITKILSMNISELMDMNDVFEDSLSEKHLQATFTNREAYQYFNNNSWAGSLDSKYNEAPIVIDWNWGGNKANLYLEKNHNLNVEIVDEDTVDITYTLSVENTSETDTYPEGKYVNYQRVYIPSYAKILTISGMEENEYSTYKESGYKVIGGWFNTDIDSTNSLEISYRLSREETSVSFPLEKDGNNIFLDLNIFKQAGEKRNAYKLDIVYPSSWTLQSSEYLNSISNQLSGIFDLDTDKEFSIGWKASN